MTFREINNMIDEMGLPYDYYQFPEDSAPPLPFIVFYYPQRNDFQADNKNYTLITALNVELCTDQKDFSLETQVEAVFNSHEIPYTKTETYIDSEQMYMILYQMEVLINA